MQLSEIYSYPLKSAKGRMHSSIELRGRGLAGDRRWMLVDSQGRFITGRILPQLVHLSADTDHSGGLLLSWRDGSRHDEPPPAKDAQRLSVRVWSDQLSAALASGTAHRWISDRLGREVRLVRMDSVSQRLTTDKLGYAPQPVSFADAYPLLLCNDSSRIDLEQSLGKPLGMARFRPNLVVSGAAAWAEDDWSVIRIGQLRFRVASACTRCVFTTVDPMRGERDADGEPLGILGRLRQRPEGVVFGVNLLALTPPSASSNSLGCLKQGDSIERLE